MGEKTEKASPKKLRDARKKGQVAKSQDLPSAFTFVASIWMVLATSETLYHYIGDFLLGIFSLIPNTDLMTTIPAMYYQAVMVILLASLPILGMISVVGVIINFLCVGPMFTFEVFKFDIKKFDPVQNLKAKFKLKTLVELLKSIVKISIAGYIIYDVMYKSMPILVKTVSMPMSSALMIFNAFLQEVLIKVGLFFLIVAVADFFYQKMSFATEMKMEKFEVKQEYKNTEGDPMIKSRRKHLAQEIAYQDGPAGAVKKAQAVVTNPTHLAIVIAYNKETDVAPYIVAMGDDLLAERLIKMAHEYDVPVVRNINLAHRLWDDGEVYDFVPDDTYEAIAEILRWIAALQSDEKYDYSAESERSGIKE